MYQTGESEIETKPDLLRNEFIRTTILTLIAKRLDSIPNHVGFHIPHQADASTLGTVAYSVSPLLSYSAMSNATITLSLTTRSGSSKNLLSTPSTPSSSPKLPNASAASCRTILASFISLNVSTRLGIDAGCDSWPNTNAISCLNKADGSANPFAKVWIAGTAVGRFGGDARSRRANMAR